MSNLYIMHYGVGHDKGGHSGRYPWGSGKNPYGGKGTKRLGRRETKLLQRELNEGLEANSAFDSLKYNTYKKWAKDISGVLGRNYTNVRFNPKNFVETGDDISAARVMSDPGAADIIRDRMKSNPSYKRDLDNLRNGYIQQYDAMEDTIKKWADQYDLTSLKNRKVSAQREIDDIISNIEKGDLYSFNPRTISDDDLTDRIINLYKRQGEAYKRSYNNQYVQDTQDAAMEAMDLISQILGSQQDPKLSRARKDIKDINSGLRRMV